MLYREIIAVCSQIHIKHINKLCGQNVELLNVKLAVHRVTTGLCEDSFTIGTAPPDSHPTAVLDHAQSLFTASSSVLFNSKEPATSLILSSRTCWQQPNGELPYNHLKPDARRPMEPVTKDLH